MNRQQQAELAELFVRAINTEAEATRVLFKDRPDLGEWTATGNARDDARQEFWQALYSIACVEDRPETSPTGL